MEMTPLIDVVFLLLTFFIFALVVLVRVDVLDVDLPTLGAGDRARDADAVTIALDRDGSLFVNAQPVRADELADRVRAAQADHPQAALLVAVDSAGERAELLGLIDLLATEGLGEFAILSRPVPSDHQPTTQPTTQPESPADRPGAPSDGP